MKNLVLIVEDNATNLKLFRDVLQVHGFDTLSAEDGISAIGLVRRHRPDMVLMDIQLPDISGLEVTRWIRADDDLCRIPIVAVTAFAMHGDEQKILRAGCDAYLAKPISIKSFMATVRGLLQRSPELDPSAAHS